MSIINRPTSFYDIPINTKVIKYSQLLKSNPKADKIFKQSFKSVSNEKPKTGVTFIPPLTLNLKSIAPLEIPDRTKFAYAPIPEKFRTAFSWNNPKNVKDWNGLNLDMAKVISPVVDQLTCGDCWAVASSSCLADRFAIAASKLTGTSANNPQFSISYILSCGADTCPNGCDGCTNDLAALILSSKGTTTAKCDDYSWCSNAASKDQCESYMIPACDSTCSDNKPFAAYHISKTSPESTDKLPVGKPILLNQIQNQLYTYGPVSTGFYVYEDFMTGSAPNMNMWSETNGIYVNIDTFVNSNDSSRIYPYTNEGQQPLGGHAVVIVGYGIDDNVPNFLKNSMPDKKVLSLPFWIVRNSWSSAWGDNGYFKIAMSDPKLGINTSTLIDIPGKDDNGQLWGGVTWFYPDSDDVSKYSLLYGGTLKSIADAVPDSGIVASVLTGGLTSAIPNWIQWVIVILLFVIIVKFFF